MVSGLETIQISNWQTHGEFAKEIKFGRYTKCVEDWSDWTFQCEYDRGF